MLKTALRYSHTLLEEIVTTGDQVIDATMGNGHDTIFLANLVGPTGQVYSFDVQESAVQTTQQKLREVNLDQHVVLLHQGHETIAEVVPKEQPIKAAVFNLGYLPASDKTIITLPETTIIAMQAILDLLQKNGRLVIVAYYGHEGGRSELQAVQKFCELLPQEEFSVLSYQFINQRNAPPVLFCIERKK